MLPPIEQQKLDEGLKKYRELLETRKDLFQEIFNHQETLYLVRNDKKGKDNFVRYLSQIIKLHYDLSDTDIQDFLVWSENNKYYDGCLFPISEFKFEYTINIGDLFSKAIKLLKLKDTEPFLPCFSFEKCVFFYGVTNLTSEPRNFIGQLYIKNCIFDTFQQDYAAFDCLVMLSIASKECQYQSVCVSASMEQSLTFQDCKMKGFLIGGGQESLKKDMISCKCEILIKGGRVQWFKGVDSVLYIKPLAILGCEIEQPPNFNGCEFWGLFILDGNKFSNLNDETKKKEVLLQNLSYRMRSAGGERAAHELHSYELSSRLLSGNTNAGWERFLSCRYYDLAEHGRSLFWPFFWLAYAWASCLVLYMLPGAITCAADGQDGWLKHVCVSQSFSVQVQMAGAYSFKQAVPFLVPWFGAGAIIANNLWVQSLAILQFAFSSLLWFFIITQIRRMFKL